MPPTGPATPPTPPVEPSGPSAPPGVGQVRTLLDTYRTGQAALSTLGAAMDPRAIYSEDMDPHPVWMNVKGEWREFKPFSLLKLSEAPVPAPPKGG